MTIRDRFWLRTGLWWFTFQRFWAKQAALGFHEQGKEEQSKIWYAKYQEYDLLIGRILAERLRRKMVEVLGLPEE